MIKGLDNVCHAASAVSRSVTIELNINILVMVCQGIDLEPLQPSFCSPPYSLPLEMDTLPADDWSSHQQGNRI
jgi:hypothetical protein